MKRIGALLCGLLLLPSVGRTAAELDQALREDVVLRALVDELERSLGGLKLEGLESPYFIEYGLLDAAVARVSAEFGAVTNRGEARQRVLRTDVRVGSYDLDNTNFSDDSYGYWRSRGGGGDAAPVPIEDDYDAIRQAVWWATDRDYKSVVETLAKKKAFMESKLIVDKPPDFSREQPSVHIEQRSTVQLDLPTLEKLAVDLSNLFRAYPDTLDSGVTVAATAGNKYLINSEGTRLRIAGNRYIVSVSAKVQADDGMELSDAFTVYVNDIKDLPSADELGQRCRALIERLIAVKKAPKLAEAYTGPVLFDAEAAAEVFSRHFGSRFTGGQRDVGSQTSPDDFANKLERRILPRFLRVLDDPTVERIGNLPVMGHYDYDDQGVPAQTVTLVEEGRLKSLLMSRNPSKEFSQSNGHGRGFYGPAAAVGCLIVSTTDPFKPDQLRQELLDGCKDEGLDFGVRIATLGSGGGGGSRSRGWGGGGTMPLAIYKVFPDGREELVRGAEIARFDLKAFKRMLAAGDDPYVLNSAGRAESNTVVAPALLFEELDLAKIDRDFDKPPILPSPLARP